jgi:hypothetical protein
MFDELTEPTTQWAREAEGCSSDIFVEFHHVAL